MMIGFGSHEREEARTIMAELHDAVRSAGWKGAKDAIKRVETRYAANADAHKDKARREAPERYARFRAEIVSEWPTRIIVFVTIHHINRNHALSPDGWAMMKGFWVLHVHERKHDRVLAYEAQVEFPTLVMGDEE